MDLTGCLSVSNEQFPLKQTHCLHLSFEFLWSSIRQANGQN